MFALSCTAPMTQPNDSATPQHLDPVSWDQLIEGIGPASCIVVLDSWMGREVSSQVSPEDIWQEALWLAWRDREQHEWRGVRPYRAWILEIGLNRIRGHARRSSALKRGGGARPALFSEMGVEEGETLGSLLPHGSTTPSRVAHTNERAQRMREALRQLPDEQAELLRKHLFEERDMTDVAEELGLGLSAAWYRFRQASEVYARLLGDA